ncbi:MAG: TIGR04211 family SH3 domain-containing protein [Desulfobacterales bacterium]|nr:TIGR04211 family SH3 domain-containing protein [Desulfobacterales bacterium]
MNRTTTYLFILILIFSFPFLINAEEYKTAYVSDILILTVRKGPARNYEVFRTIESGDQLLIIEEKDSFSKIQLKNGDIGWVQAQYLTFDTPNHIIIKQLNKKLEKLRIKNDQLLEEIKSSNKKYDQKQTNLLQEIKGLELILSKSVLERNDYKNKFLSIDKQYNELLEKSKNVVLINKENIKIKQTNKEFLEKLEILELKNKTLLKVGMIKWFLSGAGVIFLGWIIGRTVSYRSSRRTGLLG